MSEEQNDWGFHTFLRGIILFGFAILILSLVISGNIQYYIAPVMMPFIYVSIAFFILLSIIQIIRSTPNEQENAVACHCEHDHDHPLPNKRWKQFLGYAVFVAPLLFGFVLPDQMLDSTAADRRGVQLSSEFNTNAAAIQSRNAQSSVTDEYRSDRELPSELQTSDSMDLDSGGQEDIGREAVPIDEFAAGDTIDAELEHDTLDYGTDDFFTYYDDQLEEINEQSTIIIDDDNFLDMMTLLDLYLDELVGKEVTMMGFVYREDGIEDDQIVVARFAMTCCTADSAVYGVLSEGAETQQYDSDQWVRVRGKLDKTQMYDWDIPLILIEELEEVDAPDTPYVYPSFF